MARGGDQPSTRSYSELATVNFLHGPDPSAHCRVFVGNLHPLVTEYYLQDLFSIAGPVYRCDVIHDNELHYGFVVFTNRQSSIIAVGLLNGYRLFRMPLLVGWPHPRDWREDKTIAYFYVYVRGLQPWTTDEVLYAYFSVFDSCVEAKVMLDEKSQSMGYGFVSYRGYQHSYRAATELDGKLLEGSLIRCSMHGSSKELDLPPRLYKTRRFAGPSTIRLPEFPFHFDNEARVDPQYSNIYVFDLPPGISEKIMRNFFEELKAGKIEHLRMVPGKSHGFVTYSSQYEAAVAILKADGAFLNGKYIKCTWGERPTPINDLLVPVPPELTPMVAYTRVRSHRVLKGILRDGHR
ncbi:oligouridylate-binding protein 1-like [Andrographis paniculata]|uniref:oligouridylate-binding protein 1-like n=1 Tax=Andrographis paniculata TaxID=175694 RepID=UPI0021E7E7FD|nr:oligouridylate-binding protein 1-like [Andrographis paniculata]